MKRIAHYIAQTITSSAFDHVILKTCAGLLIMSNLQQALAYFLPNINT